MNKSLPVRPGYSGSSASDEDEKTPVVSYMEKKGRVADAIHRDSPSLSSRAIRIASQGEAELKIEEQKQYFWGVIGQEDDLAAGGWSNPSRRPRFFPTLCDAFEAICQLPLDQQKSEFERFLHETSQVMERPQMDEQIKNICCALIQGQIFRVDKEKALLNELRHHHAFTGFPREDLWRLCIDGRQQGRGKFVFENEPGYISGMFSGFRLMFEQYRKGEPLSVGLIKSLLFASSSFVYRLDRHNVLKPLSIKMSGGLVYYVLENNESSFFGTCPTLSRQGIKEIRHQATRMGFWMAESPDYPLSCNGEDFLNIIDYINQDMTFSVFFDEEETEDGAFFSYRTTPAGKPDEISSRMKVILSDYKKEMGLAQTEDDKYHVIVRCIRRFIHLHPFEDGNGRVFQILLCNRLLLDNGLTPVIWNNPSMVCGFSQKEILTALKQGQDAFRQCLRNASEPL